ncbi:MAG: histone-lysine N-methyltransferase [Spirochaetales bacterium]|nr:histone-lysine N-methyltransferase [Spirochaetales bacterium]
MFKSKKGKNFPLQETKEAQLFRSQFPYTEIPKILFDKQIPMPNPAKNIWITDTTFRDGQQARPPYTPNQILMIFDLLHKLGGKKGIIRQSEFFLYSKRDREAVEKCLARDYKYPEVTSWIRANSEDFELVKSMGIKETGILTSVSDYHIFLKLKSNRSKVMESYLDIVKASLDKGIIPRCHFEDVTRADIYGFCLPFAEALYKLMDESKIPIKIRLCDTMGYGVTYPGAILPRSVPKLANAFAEELGYPGELLEWHGHNDFHQVHINGTTSWLYGISALNASLLGFGERTGNPPLEAAIIEYIQLTGSSDSIDTQCITEIAEYFRKEIKADIAANYPFVGKDFNTTRAGIHADGILKNPEIYNIFDTEKILNRPLRVLVTDKSGIAGIAQWINENIDSIASGEKEVVSKRHSGIRHINNWVSEQYANGRTSAISSEELLAQTRHFLPSLFESDFEQARDKAKHLAEKIATKISNSPVMKEMEKEAVESLLHDFTTREGSIQLIALTDLEGKRISQVHTQRGEKGLFRNLLNKDFQQHEWFIKVTETGKPYYSDLFFSKYTHQLIITAALPIFDQQNTMKAILDVDFRFSELMKLISSIPEEILEVNS